MNHEDITKMLKKRANKYKRSDKPMTKKEFTAIKASVSGTTKGIRQQFRAVSAYKGGFWIQKGSYMQLMYGCHTCPLRSMCDKAPHVNGGCAERYSHVTSYLKRWQGDTIPLMEEIATMNQIVADNQYFKDTKDGGDPSITYIALRKLANDFNMHTAKLKHGSTLNIKHEVSYGDIRKKMFEKPIDVETIEEDKKDGMWNKTKEEKIDEEDLGS